jgi:hypothetical protein
MAPTRSVQSIVASLRARVRHKPEMLALAPLRQRGRRLRQRRRPHPRPRHNDKARCCRLSSNPSLSCSREPVGDSCPRGIRWPRKVPSLAPRAAGRQGYLERQPPAGLRCRIPLCQRKECDAHRKLYDDFGMLGTQPSENWRETSVSGVVTSAVPDGRQSSPANRRSSSQFPPECWRRPFKRPRRLAVACNRPGPLEETRPQALLHGSKTPKRGRVRQTKNLLALEDLQLLAAIGANGALTAAARKLQLDQRVEVVEAPPATK